MSCARVVPRYMFIVACGPWSLTCALNQTWIADMSVGLCRFRYHGLPLLKCENDRGDLGIFEPIGFENGRYLGAHHAQAEQQAQRYCAYTARDRQSLRSQEEC